MHRSHRLLVTVLAFTLAACGSDGPTTPPVTTPPAPVETFAVTVIVYDDENHNGRNDDRESVWLPDVEVEIAGKVGRSERRTGRAIIAGVPRGQYQVTFRAASLSPYYAPGAPVTVDVPQSPDSTPKVGLVIPIGTNRPGHYLFSGDSISQGTGAFDNRGFRPALRNQLEDYFGRASEGYLGAGGGRSPNGAERIGGDIDAQRPAMTVLNWGVNDYYEDGCGSPTSATCTLGNNLRSMIRSVRARNSLPALATLIPCNTGYNEQAPPERNTWVRAANDMIRSIARDERVLLVDVGAEFFQQSDLSRLFVDHVHPNDAGYALMAQVYFRALTRGSVSGAAASAPVFGFLR